jgi:hypothetical protein
MSNQVFGRWTVLRQDTQKEHYFICRCSCGTERSVDYRELERGNSSSCGCLMREQVSERNKGRKANLVGQSIGKWNVTCVDPEDDKRYLCKCSCGSPEKSVSHANLRNGRSTSCGCMSREGASKKAKELRGINENKLIGKQVSRWIVLSVEGKNEYGQWQYLCQCDCGTRKVISKISLLSGKSQSCGCLNSELVSEREIKIHQDYRVSLGYDKDMQIKKETAYLRARIVTPRIKEIIQLIDNSKCAYCSKENVSLYVHHALLLEDFLDLNDKNTYGMIYSLLNLISLCPECHDRAHAGVSGNVNKDMQDELFIIMAKRNIPINLQTEYDSIINERILPFIQAYVPGERTGKTMIVDK